MSTLILLQPNDVCVVQLERLCLGSRAIIGVTLVLFHINLRFLLTSKFQHLMKSVKDKKVKKRGLRSHCCDILPPLTIEVATEKKILYVYNTIPTHTHTHIHVINKYNE